MLALLETLTKANLALDARERPSHKRVKGINRIKGQTSLERHRFILGRESPLAGGFEPV
jgi:hypothetical protein